MSIYPTNLKKYGWIWGTIEWVELKARYASGGAGAPTKLIAINAVDNTEQWNINIDTLAADPHPLKRSDPHYLDLSLEKRDTCADNLAYEVNMDWFG